MKKILSVFSGFSVDDIAKAQKFYSETLGLNAETNEMGMEISLPDGGHVFVYPKEDHKPADFTILNLVVKSIDDTIEELVGKGVEFERYDNMPAEQDEKGVLRGLAANMGPDIAWFKDPAGNVMAILQDS